MPRRRASRPLRALALLGVALLLGAPVAAAGSASTIGVPERHLHAGALPLAFTAPAAATAGAAADRPEGGPGARIGPARLSYAATTPDVRSPASRVRPAYGPLTRWCLAHATSTAEP